MSGLEAAAALHIATSEQAESSHDQPALHGSPSPPPARHAEADIDAVKPPILRTSANRWLRIRHPLILAPMAYDSDGLLAGSVAAAGGFGFLGAGAARASWIKEQYAIACRVACGKPAKQKEQDAASGEREASPVHHSSSSDGVMLRPRIGIGLISWRLHDDDEALRAALECKPAAIWLSYGSVEPFITSIKQAGVEHVFVMVNSAREAIHAVEMGADVVVAQGEEAGGHGQPLSSTMCLVQDIVAALGNRALILAAGGIVCGRGMVSALSLGAAGVAMGTRFFCTQECPASQAKKDRIMEVAEAAQTVRTRVFTLYTGSWPREYDARTVSNDQTERYRGPEAEGLLRSALDMEAATAPSSLVTLQGLRETAGFRQPPSIGVSPRWADSSTLRQQFADALRKGDVHEIPIWAGAGSGRIKDCPPVAVLVERLMNEAAATIKGLQKFVS